MDLPPNSNDEPMPPLTLTETPGTMSPPTQSDAQPLWQSDDELTDRLYRDMQKSEVLHSLYPYKLALTPADVDSCAALENACFLPDLAANRNKVRNIYPKYIM